MGKKELEDEKVSVVIPCYNEEENVIRGAVQLFFLGFMGEYIMSMNRRIMNRPLVAEEEKINFEDAKG